MVTADVLSRMAGLVRAGQLQEAAALGLSHHPPLSLAAGDLQLKHALGGGSESTILAAEYRGKAVAYKKAKVSSTEALERFRHEVAALAQLHHANVVPLLAAHAMPPAYAMVLPRYESSLEVCTR